MAEYWCSFKRVSTQLYRGIDQALSSSWRPESWYADPKVFFSHILKRHPPIMLIFELICNWSPVGYDKVIYDRLQGTLKIERPIYFFLLESDSSKQTNATALFSARGKGRVQMWVELYQRKKGDPITNFKKISINSYQYELYR